MTQPNWSPWIDYDADAHGGECPPEARWVACDLGRGCTHEFAGWREFDDGHGGEQVCKKCGIGAMAATLAYLP